VGAGRTYLSSAIREVEEELFNDSTLEIRLMELFKFKNQKMMISNSKWSTNGYMVVPLVFQQKKLILATLLTLKNSK